MCIRDRITGAHTHGSPIVTASRLPSFQSQTRTGTVAVRFPDNPRKSRLRFAASGPHSPPRWRTRGRRCDVSLPPQEESYFGDQSGRLTSPGPGTNPPIAAGGVAHTRPSLRHTNERVLAEPCLLYTSDAADDLLCVDLGGRRI